MEFKIGNVFTNTCIFFRMRRYFEISLLEILIVDSVTVSEASHVVLYRPRSNKKFSSSFQLNMNFQMLISI